MSNYRQYIKPLVDVIFASIALVILLPVLFLITLIQMFLYKGSPLFLQRRPGRNEKLFTLIKFRTMLDTKNEFGSLLTDQKRITTFGLFLRSTSLDELPQLINVLKGEMSLVGPRPLLIEYLPFYNNYQKRRHLVKPGITGWAQVNGRDNISWEQKFDFDVWYVENISFGLDIKILFKTTETLIKNRNLKKEQTQVVKFKGSNFQKDS
ncbi:sugar transferase [Pontibacter populi]|uniref:Sugar transferase n=1 Tax=Pontibacter populi TaxID=890055 RepID=A0ABV1RVS0_9BACT